VPAASPIYDPAAQEAADVWRAWLAPADHATIAEWVRRLAFAVDFAPKEEFGSRCDRGADPRHWFGLRPKPDVAVDGDALGPGLQRRRPTYALSADPSVYSDREPGYRTDSRATWTGQIVCSLQV
jgi:hypothetical protein